MKKLLVLRFLLLVGVICLICQNAQAGLFDNITSQVTQAVTNASNKQQQQAAQQQAASQQAPVTSPATQEQTVQNGQSTNQVTTQQICDWFSKGMSDNDIIAKIHASDSLYSLNDIMYVKGQGVSTSVLRVMQNQDDWIRERQRQKEQQAEQEQFQQQQAEQAKQEQVAQQQAAQQQAAQRQAAQQQADQQAAQAAAALAKRPAFNAKYDEFNWGDGLFTTKAKLALKGKNAQESDTMGLVYSGQYAQLRGKFLTYNDTVFETPCTVTLGFSIKTEKLSVVIILFADTSIGETLSNALIKKYGPLSDPNSITWGGVKNGEDTLILTPNMLTGGQGLLMEYISGEDMPLLASESDEVTNAKINQDSEKL